MVLLLLHFTVGLCYNCLLDLTFSFENEGFVKGIPVFLETSVGKKNSNHKVSKFSVKE